MPGSRGSNPNGVDPAAIAAWRSRTFRGLRPPSFAGADDRRPLDPLDDPDAVPEDGPPNQ